CVSGWQTLFRFRLFSAAPVKTKPKAATSRRRRRSELRDFQRTRLYRWENELVFPADRQLLPLDACTLLVEQAYRWAEAEKTRHPDWSPPLVFDGRGRRHACGSRESIKLPRWARSRPVVLHECAHGLAPDKHGPQFVRTYIELLAQFLDMDRDALLGSALQAGLCVEGHTSRPQGAKASRASAGRS
ncbi:MAG: hypothetical protein AB7F74_30830, partial [Parvibaculaceae bacterium]